MTSSSWNYKTHLWVIHSEEVFSICSLSCDNGILVVAEELNITQTQNYLFFIIILTIALWYDIEEAEGWELIKYVVWLSLILKYNSMKFLHFLWWTVCFSSLFSCDHIMYIIRVCKNMSALYMLKHFSLFCNHFKIKFVLTQLSHSP